MRPVFLSLSCVPASSISLFAAAMTSQRQVILSHFAVEKHDLTSAVVSFTCKWPGCSKKYSGGTFPTHQPAFEDLHRRAFLFRSVGSLPALAAAVAMSTHRLVAACRGVGGGQH